MYYLSSSLSDRINYDEAARAYARECMRGAEMPIREIDPVTLARHVIALEGLPETDDPEEAEARFIDAFIAEHAEMLRDEIDDAIDEYDVGDIEAHVRPCRLLWMPNADSLEALGDAAGYFGDNGGDPAGDLWLAPAEIFSDDQIASAVRAGGKVIDGYAFPYPSGVDIDRYMQCIIEPGCVAIGGWCAYSSWGDVGYALDRNIATAVCAASIAQAKEEEEEEEENQD